MSHSNDSTAPCADKGGHGQATNSLCDALRSGARGQKKRNLATVMIEDPPTGKREAGLMDVESDAAILITHWEMLRGVYGGGLSPIMGKYSRALNPIERISIFSLSRSEEEKKGWLQDNLLAVLMCFRRRQFRTSKSSGIASSGTSCISPSSGPCASLRVNPAATLPRMSSVIK